MNLPGDVPEDHGWSGRDRGGDPRGRRGHGRRGARRGARRGGGGRGRRRRGGRQEVQEGEEEQGREQEGQDQVWEEEGLLLSASGARPRGEGAGAAVPPSAPRGLGVFFAFDLSRLVSR